MRRFALGLRLLAPVPVLVGLIHLVLGLRADALLGAVLPPAVLADAALDSQNRFYGTSFMVYGALLWLAATDLSRYAPALRIALGFFFAGGISRIVSIASHGWPTAPVAGLLVLELTLAPALLLWLHRIDPDAKRVAHRRAPSRRPPHRPFRPGEPPSRGAWG